MTFWRVWNPTVITHENGTHHFFLLLLFCTPLRTDWWFIFFHFSSIFLIHNKLFFLLCHTKDCCSCHVGTKSQVHRWPILGSNPEFWTCDDSLTVMWISANISAFITANGDGGGELSTRPTFCDPQKGFAKLKWESDNFSPFYWYWKTQSYL